MQGARWLAILEDKHSDMNDFGRLLDHTENDGTTIVLYNPVEYSPRKEIILR